MGCCSPARLMLAEAADTSPMLGWGYARRWSASESESATESTPVRYVAAWSCSESLRGAAGCAPTDAVRPRRAERFVALPGPRALSTPTVPRDGSRGTAEAASPDVPALTREAVECFRVEEVTPEAARFAEILSRWREGDSSARARMLPFDALRADVRLCTVDLCCLRDMPAVDASRTARVADDSVLRTEGVSSPATTAITGGAPARRLRRAVSSELSPLGGGGGPPRRRRDEREALAARSRLEAWR